MAKRVNGLTNETDIRNFEKQLKKIDERYYLLWRIGVETGLRVSDILALRLIDVQMDPIQLIEKKTKKHKQVQITDKTYANLQRFAKQKGLKASDYIVYSKESNHKKPICRQHAHRIFALASKKAGLNGIGTHSMRKTYAQNYFASTNDLEGLQRDLNHEYMSTTLTYLINTREGKFEIGRVNSGVKGTVE